MNELFDETFNEIRYLINPQRDCYESAFTLLTESISNNILSVVPPSGVWEGVECTQLGGKEVIPDRPSTQEKTVQVIQKNK